MEDFSGTDTKQEINKLKTTKKGSKQNVLDVGTPLRR